MKILLISNFFPPHFIGGAEIIAHRQALALQARGHEVRVLAGDNSRPQPGYPVLHETFDDMPVTRVALQPADFAPTGNNVAHPEVDDIFDALVDEWLPDVVHAHHLVGLSLGIIQRARARGIRVVLTLHDHWGFCIKSIRMTDERSLCVDSTGCSSCHASIHVGSQPLPQRMRQDYLRWQFSGVDRFISPSDYLADAYVATGFDPARMQVVANGIELDTYANVPRPAFEGRLRVLFIGYMGEHKGVPTLLRALARLPADRLQVDFVGDGHLRIRYQDELRRLAPDLPQRFWGRLPNDMIAERMAATHVFVLPSVCPENQPVTITEAMASGVPVVASRIGGIPELVVDGVNGWLFEPGNDEDLARQLMTYLDQPALLDAHAEAGRTRIRDYAFNRQIDRLEQILGGQRPLPPPPAFPRIACFGVPTPSTWQRILQQVASVLPGQPQPEHQPCIVPAGWIQPHDASMLWVAGSTAGRQDEAVAMIQAYLLAGRPVLLDERCQALARRFEGQVLLARGAQGLSLSVPELLRRQG
ncbi:glycosyltransferase family 4 protein [Pseudomonas kunmingensis]|uniref:glycosyltransferase family 4 protein n=1 Tax=Stutzerimonas kunmingensis TaxID=1211807 RepID=UPI001745DBC2|nr:glycosyltransferase family 4 protein [Stutzerimonas kunmingensis]MBD3876339.1 glycosyltransferase family 4 protein [Stutzerimonas kunmingensis]